ncbi:MAG TPA: DUF6484 domain-containing protein [Albitalea sp.]|uniref:DUF6484 domain-containing protein n=1 Tax=Piscinibacter sp. TaxID=1903157 RepID=UPI002ED48E40
MHDCATSTIDDEALGYDPLGELLARPTRLVQPREAAVAAASGAVVGELIAIADTGRTPLVCYPGQPGAQALAARTVVPLGGEHVGRALLLVFEHNDPARPVVMGVLHEAAPGSPEHPPASVHVAADGQHLTVSAGEELELRCGRARILLTRDGTVHIEGQRIVSRADGVNRILGGSVQIN